MIYWYFAEVDPKLRRSSVAFEELCCSRGGRRRQDEGDEEAGDGSFLLVVTVGVKGTYGIVKNEVTLNRKSAEFQNKSVICPETGGHVLTLFFDT